MKYFSFFILFVFNTAICISQNNWTYIHEDSISTLFVSSLEAPNGDLIVLESNITENPNFKSQCKLRRFSSAGKPLEFAEISLNELNLYGSELFSHPDYFLFIGMIFYPKDSFRNDLMVRRYDYDFNLLQENIYPSSGYLAVSMRTHLIHNNFYVSSIFAYERTTRESTHNMFKLDTLGNLILQKDFNYINPCYLPSDFISIGSDKDFIGIADEFLFYNDSLRIYKKLPLPNGLNYCTNFITLFDYTVNEFICYWLDNQTGRNDFDIGLSTINKNTLKINNTILFGTSKTDDIPTFNRGFQGTSDGNYYISGTLEYGFAFDTSTFVIAQLDNDFNTNWIRYINLGYFTTSYNNTLTNDGGLLLCSMLKAPAPAPFFSKGCLIKISKDGEFGGTTSSDDPNKLSGILLKIFDDYLQIEIDKMEGDIQFSILDLQGKEIIKDRKMYEGTNKVKIPNLLPGVYPFKFHNSKGIINQGKLLFSK